MDELTRLRKENVSLLETKDALNTVKDDLIKELEQIASQYAKIKLELDMAKKEKGLQHRSIHNINSIFRFLTWTRELNGK